LVNVIARYAKEVATKAFGFACERVYVLFDLTQLFADEAEGERRVISSKDEILLGFS